MDATFINRLPIQVRFSDIDMMGHVSNTIYQNYYDSGKINYFDDVIPEMDIITVGVVAASVKLDFLKPIYIKTKIFVESRISVIGHKSLSMEQRLVEEDINEALSTCSTIMVCYDVKNKISIPIPEEWKYSIIGYDKNVIIKK